MALPLQVRNAFRRGLERAASVPASAPRRRAWVWVQPVLREGKSFSEMQAEWTLRRVAASRFEDAVVGYRVRYFEVSEEGLEGREIGHLPVEVELLPVLDQRVEVTDDSELESVLSAWLDDLEALRDPLSVDCFPSVLA